MYTFHETNLKDAFDTSQNNYVCIGIREYKAENGIRKLKSTIDVMPRDIVQGSFKITSAITSAKNYTAGGCVAAELQFTINNYNGKFDNATFEGKECYVYMGNRDTEVYDEESEEYIVVPNEYYVIDSASEWNVGAYTKQTPRNTSVETPCVITTNHTTAYYKNGAKYGSIDELLPMGIFIIDSVKQYTTISADGEETLKQIKIVAYDRMRLLDDTVALYDFANLTQTQTTNSIQFRSIQLALVVQKLQKELYDYDLTNFVQLSDITGNFYAWQGASADTSSVISSNNMGTSNFALAWLFYSFDNFTDWSRVDSDRTTYSSNENYIPFTRKGVTYRNVLQYLCEIAGCNAYFNRYGKLEFDWVSSALKGASSSTEISVSWKNRRSKFDLSPSNYKDFNYLTINPIVLNGFLCTYYDDDSYDGTEYKAKVGENGQIFDLNNNKLIGATTRLTSTAISPTKKNQQLSARFAFQNRLHYDTISTPKAFTYMPFEVNYLNTPYLDLCDAVALKTAGEYDSYLTDITYTNSVYMKLKARGENE